MFSRLGPPKLRLYAMRCTSCEVLSPWWEHHHCYACGGADMVEQELSGTGELTNYTVLWFAAIGIVFGSRKLCDLIGAPLWFAKYLFICASLITAYFLTEEVVPNNPWAVWLAMLGAATGMIPVGFIVFKHIADDGRKVQDFSE